MPQTGKNTKRKPVDLSLSEGDRPLIMEAPPLQLPDAQHSSLTQLREGRRECDREMMEMESLQGLEARIEVECPNVFIGKQGKFSSALITVVSNYSSVTPGMLVDVHCEEKEGRPFIAEVVKRDGEDVEVEWLKGSWKGIWRHWIVRKRRYTSHIPVTSLILWDFALTSKGRLRTKTVNELKGKYEQLDEEEENC